MQHELLFGCGELPLQVPGQALLVPVEAGAVVLPPLHAWRLQPEVHASPVRLAHTQRAQDGGLCGRPQSAWSTLTSRMRSCGWLCEARALLSFRQDLRAASLALCAPSSKKKSERRSASSNSARGTKAVRSRLPLQPALNKEAGQHRVLRQHCLTAWEGGAPVSALWRLEQLREQDLLLQRGHRYRPSCELQISQDLPCSRVPSAAISCPADPDL